MKNPTTPTTRPTQRIVYRELPGIPKLSTELLRAARGLLPLAGSRGRGQDNGRQPRDQERPEPQPGAPSLLTQGFLVGGVAPDTGQLAAYCRATGLRLADTLPVTFPYVIAFPLAVKLMNLPGVPFAAVGAVHLKNRIEQRAPLHVGDDLQLRVHAENPRAHRAGLLLDVVTEVAPERSPRGKQDDRGSNRSGPGAPAWRQISSFLAKGEPAAGLPPAGPSGVSRTGEPTGRPIFATATRKRIGAYARASGDKNPIHVSRLGAKAFGFPTTIAHGMWSAAFMLAQLEGRHPEQVRFDVEFGKPVRLPGKLAFFARPTDHDGRQAPAGPGPARDAGRPDGWELQLRSAARPEIIHAVGRLDGIASSLEHGLE